jgi:hypothetical protein
MGEQLSPIELAELKDFSKSNFQAERDRCAQEITEARQSYFRRRSSFLERLEFLRPRIETTPREIQCLQDEIDKLQQSLDRIKASVIKSILLFYASKKLSDQIGNKQSKIQYLEGCHNEDRARCAEYERDLATEKELRQDRQILAEFIRVQRERFRESQEIIQRRDSVNKRQRQLEEESEDIKFCDVRYVSRELKVLFVHTISNTWNGAKNKNPLVNESTPEAVRIKIVCAIQPCISASTIKQEDSPYNTVAGSCPGLIIGEGIITRCAPEDINLQIEGDGLRTPRFSNNLENFSEEALGRLTRVSKRSVKNSVNYRRATGYNEFAISEATPCALYVPMIMTDGYFKPVESASEYLSLAEDLGLPGYYFGDGQFFQAVKNETGDWQTGDLIPINEIVAEPNFISDSKRRNIAAELELG